MACGCGDDAFDDVKNWLIVQGRETYEKVLDNPDNLADVVPRKHRFDLGDVRLPEHDITIANVAEVAYEQKTREPTDHGYEETPKLIGELMSSIWKPEPSEEEYQAKFPRIMEKLGRYSDEDSMAWDS